jgi:hypothetical protein
MASPLPPKRRVQLSEIITIDDLINLISEKAHTRRGRMVVSVSSVLLLGAIIFTPLVLHATQRTSPSSTPATPVVTVPPANKAQTTRLNPLIVPIDTANDRTYYGPRITATTVAAPPPTPPTTAAPPTTAPAIAAPVQTAPPVTYPQVTYPQTPATPPPTSPPVTSPPLQLPTGPITAGG